MDLLNTCKHVLPVVYADHMTYMLLNQLCGLLPISLTDRSLPILSLFELKNSDGFFKKTSRIRKGGYQFCFMHCHFFTIAFLKPECKQKSYKQLRNYIHSTCRTPTHRINYVAWHYCRGCQHVRCGNVKATISLLYLQ